MGALGRNANRIALEGIDGSKLDLYLQRERVYTGGGKVGATSGWVVAAATNIFRMATCPASQSASTLVVPLGGLRIGDTIRSFTLYGQIESAGGAVTLDANLRSLTGAAADLADASIASMTQISITADTLVNAANGIKSGLSTVVTAGVTYYMLLTATTAASTDIDLQGIGVVSY